MLKWTFERVMIARRGLGINEAEARLIPVCIEGLIDDVYHPLTAQGERLTTIARAPEPNVCEGEWFPDALQCSVERGKRMNSLLLSIDALNLERACLLAEVAGV